MVEVVPICFKCIHYFITHDPGRPYGCRAMAFKSRTNPAQVVLQSSGMNCQLFTPKKRPNSKVGSNKVA
jgi:hypothetical protein